MKMRFFAVIVSLLYPLVTLANEILPVNDSNAPVKIISKSATGELQTTVIDESGRLNIENSRDATQGMEMTNNSTVSPIAPSIPRAPAVPFTSEHYQHS